MATRRPIKPIQEQGHCLSEEKKRRPKDNGLSETVVLAVACAIAYPFVMVGRLVKRVLGK